MEYWNYYDWETLATIDYNWEILAIIDEYGLDSLEAHAAVLASLGQDQPEGTMER